MRNARCVRMMWLWAWIVGPVRMMALVGLIGLALAAGASPAAAAVGDWRGILIAPPGINTNSHVDDGWVVWVNQAGSRSIRVFDCAAGTTHTVGEVESFFANCTLDDGRVAWLSRVDGRIHLHVHDLTTGTTTQVTSGSEEVMGYSLDGNLLVWWAGSDAASEVYLRDLATGVTTRLTSNGYWDGHAVVGDGLVVWLGTPDGAAGDDEVFMRHAGAAVGERLTYNSVDDTFAQTNCGYVVWQAPIGGDPDIVGFDALLRRSRVLTDNTLGDTAARLEGDYLAWVTGPTALAGTINLMRLHDGLIRQPSLAADTDGVLALDLGQVAWVDPEVGQGSVMLYDPALILARRMGAVNVAAHSPSMDGGLLVWKAGPVDETHIMMAAREAFPDVPAYHLHGSAIGELARRDVISGYLSGSFGPNDPVTRQQFAKMAVLALLEHVSEADVCLFNDVEFSGVGQLYPDNYIAVATRLGLTVGVGGGRFDPYAQISRAQVITMVVRAVQTHLPELLRTPGPGFQSTWGSFDTTHSSNVRIAEFNHLLDGLRLRGVDPWGSMSRAECAQVLYNMVYGLGIVPPVEWE